MVANEWRSDYDPTIEDSYTCMLHVNGRHEQLDILDTAGQEQYPALMYHWIRESDIFMIVYDIRSLRTFKHAEEVYRKLLRNKEDELIHVILVGNKSDLYRPMDTVQQKMQLTRSNIKDLVYGYVRRIERTTKRFVSIPVEMKQICLEFHGKSVSERIEVTYEMGKKLAESWEVPFFETSAKTGENVVEAFESLVVLSQRKRHAARLEDLPAS